MGYMFGLAFVALIVGIAGVIVQGIAYSDERRMYKHSVETGRATGFYGTNRTKKRMLAEQKGLRFFAAVLILSPLAGIIVPVVAVGLVSYGLYKGSRFIFESPEKVVKNVKTD